MKRWNPWRTLRDRRHIRFALRPLPGEIEAVYGRRGDRAAIIIDPELSQVDRAAALGHELVHDERGVPPMNPPQLWVPVVAKEEAAVDREVARRMMPLDTLAAYVDSMEEMGVGVTAANVAVEFDVALWVAVRALALLREAA